MNLEEYAWESIMNRGCIHDDVLGMNDPFQCGLCIQEVEDIIERGSCAQIPYVLGPLTKLEHRKAEGYDE